MWNDPDSNQSWTIASQGAFILGNINTMEQELLAFLDYRLQVQPEALMAFTKFLQHGCIDQALYPTKPAGPTHPITVLPPPVLIMSLGTMPNNPMSMPVLSTVAPNIKKNGSDGSNDQ